MYGEELRYAVSGNFGVELQRSMDYFDSQMRQAPVQKIYVNLALKDPQRVLSVSQFSYVS